MNKDIKTIADLASVTHWKVGDGMKLGKVMPNDYLEGFIIGNIALIQNDDKHFELAYFDEYDRFRGAQNITINPPA